MTSVAGLVEAMRSIPETQLRIFALARELMGPDGEMDMARAASRAPEIEEACEEAGSYRAAVKKMQWQLKRLLAPQS